MRSLDEVLTFYRFPKSQWKVLRTTVYRPGEAAPIDGWQDIAHVLSQHARQIENKAA